MFENEEYVDENKVFGKDENRSLKPKRVQSDEEKEYIKFMYNPDNAYNCENCPENRNFKNYRGMPCGQQNCWVDCHCNSRDRK